MVQPVSILNQRGQSIITLYLADGTELVQLAVGNKTISGFDDNAAWAGVATHAEGEAFAAGDGAVVLAGLDATDGETVRPVIVDTAGQILTDAAARRVKIAQTPTITAGAYVAKDVIGTLLTFAGAARTGKLSGVLETVVIVDKGQQMAALDLVLFSATVTPAADNAPFDPTDAEMLTCIGVVEVLTTDYNDFTDNSVATVKPNHAYVLAGTPLYGVLVSRGTPTYTSTSDLVVSLIVRTD